MLECDQHIDPVEHRATNGDFTDKYDPGQRVKRVESHRRFFVEHHPRCNTNTPAAGFLSESVGNTRRRSPVAGCETLTDIPVVVCEFSDQEAVARRAAEPRAGADASSSLGRRDRLDARQFAVTRSGGVLFAWALPDNGG